MLRNRLSILLAERNLTATQVSEETGISRSTLSILINNNGDGIQFKTLDKLCSYLETTPSDFFVFSPYNFKFYYDETTYNEAELGGFYVEYVKDNYTSKNYYALTIANEDYSAGEDFPVTDFDLYVIVEPYSSGTTEFEEIFQELPTTLKNIIRQDFSKIITDEVQKIIEKNKLIKNLNPNKKEILTSMFHTPVQHYLRKFDIKNQTFSK